MKPTKKPANMMPGAREIPGSSLSNNAFGEATEISGEFAPAGLDFKPSGPTQVVYYNNATPPPAGGGMREKMQIKSKPMGGE